MTHQEFERRVDAYVDGELAPEETRGIAAHLEACPRCAALARSRLVLRGAIRDEMPELPAPEALQRRVRAALREASLPAPLPAPAPSRPRGAPAAGWRWLGLAASLAVVGFGGWVLGQRRSAEEVLAGQLLASHVRSLMPGHLTDVVSSDQHTVKPWFNGKLDFSPPVYDFAGRGFPLLGGRLDYVGGRAVAALAYGRREHLINVFLWPAAGNAPSGTATTTRQGYHLLRWTASGYTWVLASDLSLSELAGFQLLLQQGDSAAAPK